MASSAGDDEADRDRVADRLVPAASSVIEDEVGRVRDRRQRVGRQHGQARDARQALVMREMRRNRFAEEKALEARKAGLVRTIR